MELDKSNKNLQFDKQLLDIRSRAHFVVESKELFERKQMH
jgi:hypothetical protein